MAEKRKASIRDMLFPEGEQWQETQEQSTNNPVITPTININMAAPGGVVVAGKSIEEEEWTELATVRAALELFVHVMVTLQPKKPPYDAEVIYKLCHGIAKGCDMKPEMRLVMNACWGAKSMREDMTKAQLDILYKIMRTLEDYKEVVGRR